MESGSGDSTSSSGNNTNTTFILKNLKDLDTKEECLLVPPPSPEITTNPFHFENVGRDNVAIGKNALKANTSGSYNFIVGCNSGINITTENCNFIFGDDIPGEAKDHQFLIGDRLPDLTYKQVGSFMQIFEEIYEKLNKEYPQIRDTLKIPLYTDDQLTIMKEKLIELKNRYAHMF